MRALSRLQGKGGNLFLIEKREINSSRISVSFNLGNAFALIFNFVHKTRDVNDMNKK